MYVYKLYTLTILIAVLMASCGPARFVEPLERKQNAISVDLGGPVVEVPGVATTPLPFSSITYGRGLSHRLTLHGSWYTTAAVFGVAQIGGGATYGLWKSENEKHGFTSMLGFTSAFDVFENNFKFWPQLDAHYFLKYDLKKLKQDDLLTNGRSVANMLYFGVGTWYELDRVKAHNEKQEDFVLPMINVGHDLNWKNWTLKTEIKLLAPFNSNKNVVLDYKSLTGESGAVGVYLGVLKKF